VRYRFEDCTLDLRQGCLRIADREVELRPKSFAMLRLLIENAGRLMPKEEIVAAIWPKAVATDDSLARCISDVRAALGDQHRRVIRTIPKRGYLFTAAVDREGDADARDEDTTGESSRRVPDSGPSIAVLAFANVSGDPREEYLSDGITEDIITELSRFSQLRVIARNSTFQYKGKPTDVRQIGRELGARYVLEGSIRRDRDRIRISAQLIDTADGTHRWAERYDRKLEDTFKLQSDLAGEIVTALAVHVNRAEAERALAKSPSTWQAHDYCLQATQLVGSYHSSFSKDELHEARRLFQKALEIDPGYARVHAALALSYVSSWVHRWDHDCPWPNAIERATIGRAPLCGWHPIWRRSTSASATC
jgi:TolB-like protein